jgi:hypothetical protein
MIKRIKISGSWSRESGALQKNGRGNQWARRKGFSSPQPGLLISFHGIFDRSPLSHHRYKAMDEGRKFPLGWDIGWGCCAKNP